MSLTQPTGKRESERGRTKSLQESLEKHTTIQVASTASSTMLDIKDYSPPLMTTAQRISRRLWNFGNGASQAIQPTPGPHLPAKVMKINVTGVFSMLKYVSKVMIDQQLGSGIGQEELK